MVRVNKITRNIVLVILCILMIVATVVPIYFRNKNIDDLNKTIPYLEMDLDYDLVKIIYNHTFTNTLVNMTINYDLYFLLKDYSFSISSNTSFFLYFYFDNLSQSHDVRINITNIDEQPFYCEVEYVGWGEYNETFCHYSHTSINYDTNVLFDDSIGLHESFGKLMYPPHWKITIAGYLEGWW